MTHQELLSSDLIRDVNIHGEKIAALEVHKDSTNEGLREIKGDLRWLVRGIVVVLLVVVLNLGVLLVKRDALQETGRAGHMAEVREVTPAQ